jgi:hypothetical protein
MIEQKIRKEIEIEKWKNLSKQLGKEIEYLLDEIEDLKKQWSSTTAVQQTFRSINTLGLSQPIITVARSCV